MAPRATLKFSLLENGLDFMKMGVEAVYGDAGANDPRSYKYALLHIFAGTLLLLKERLRREHPALIFKDVSSARTPGASTVDFDEVLKRLAAAGVVIEDADIKRLRRVQRERNQLEHFEVDLNVEHADAIIGELVEFLDRFLPELGERLHEHVSRDAWWKVQELSEVAARLRQDRIDEWKGRAAQYEGLTKRRLKELLSEIEPYHPKHNPDPVEMIECPSCGMESVVSVEHDIGKCTSPECAEVTPLDECPRCSRTVAALDFDGFCDRCLDEISEN